MTELALQWDEGKYMLHRKLGEYVQFFQVGFPVNPLGVPSKLVMPQAILEDLIDYESTDDVPDAVLEAATVEIDYHESIPTIDGLPIWERFDGEPMPYYKLFKDYRDMVALYGTRSLAKVADKYGLLGKYVSALSKVYNWSLRCKVYDSIKRIEAERKRQHEVEQLSSKHSQVAAKMLEQGMQYLEDHPEQLNPKLALQMIEMSMKAGRLALGLNADKPGTTSEAATNINIQQTASSAGASASVEMSQTSNQGKKEVEDSYLQSILHVLDQSGAFSQAKGEVIDASFTEVESTEPAAEGTSSSGGA